MIYPFNRRVQKLIAFKALQLDEVSLRPDDNPLGMSSFQSRPLSGKTGPRFH